MRAHAKHATRPYALFSGGCGCIGAGHVRYQGCQAPKEQRRPSGNDAAGRLRVRHVVRAPKRSVVGFTGQEANASRSDGNGRDRVAATAAQQKS